MELCTECGRDIERGPKKCRDCLLKESPKFWLNPEALDKFLDKMFYLIVLIGVIKFVFILEPKMLQFLSKQGNTNGVKSNLSGIYGAEMEFFKKTKRFSDSWSQINWLPQGGTRYTFFLGDQTIPNTNGGTECRKLPMGIKSEVNKNGFAAIASGNRDSDLTCDVWSIDNNRNLRRLINDQEE